ncbi:MAG: insulinase family protein, partial [bacterium]|nr:insulinase family protein [bacterium]
RAAVVGTLTLAVALAAAAAEPPAERQLPAGMHEVVTVEGITEYQLDNGLRVLFFRDPSKQTITVNVTYLVGSKHENYGETGMAHLLEHLVFQGTPGHPDISQELTEHGARANGSTWFDRTNYYETFTATEENLRWALDLEADRMVNSFIAKEDLDSEMTVVRNEFEIGENYPRDVLMDRLLSTAYLWHNYGNATIGSRSDIENVPIDRLQGFYRTWYQPDNAVLVVAGNFDPASTLALVAEKFGVLARPVRDLPKLYTREPAQDGERLVTLHRVGDVQVIGAAYHVPAGSHPDYAAVDLLSHILGNAPSGRLHKALVETGKAAGVYAFDLQLAEPGLLFCFAEVRQGKSLAEARDVLLAEVEQLAEHPPTAEEVERARENRLSGWRATMRNSERAAIRLSEWACQGDWRLMFLHRDRLREVTPEDVARAAAAYLKPINRTLGLYHPTDEPQRAEIPADPDVAALVADYQGGEPLAEGEVADTSIAAIEALAERSELPSGLKLTLVPKKTRAEIVQLVMNLHFSDLESLRGRTHAARLAGEMLMRGTQNRSRQEIRDELDRLKARLQVVGGAFGDNPGISALLATGVSARLEVEQANLPAALRLMAEILRQPSFPAEELELLKQERLARLEDSKSDPFQRAITAFLRHYLEWPPEDPRYVETPDEEIAGIEKATLDEVRSFYADFYGASTAELAAVGDFDPAELRTLVAELYADWRSPRPYVRLSFPYRAAPALVSRIETPDKESAVFIAGTFIELRDEDPDYPALVLGNFMTGGGFLSSRLATRLRQQEGLSYGVGSDFFASPGEALGGFFAYAIHAPQNADRLVTAFKEEIRKILDAGFTEEEIAAAKEGWLQQRELSLSQERELAVGLAVFEHLDRTLAWEAELEAKIEALRPEEILEAFRRHLDLEKMSIIQAGDFARV